MTTNKDKNLKVANDLYRVHCYTTALAKLCSTGGPDNAIEPEQLEQIFKDIAEVTDAGVSALNNASKSDA